MFVIPEREALTLTNDRPAYATTQKAAKGGQQLLNSLLPLTLPSTNNPVDCLYERKPKSLISRRWSDKSALTYGEKMQCNSYEILKQLGCSRVTAFRTFFSQALLASKKAPTASARNPQVQDDGKSLVKDAQSQCPPLEGGPEFLIPRRGTKNYDEIRHEATEPAFTLAEVLITLAIIGIVAVLTLPQIVSSYNKNVAETKLRKFYANMQNAVALSEIENGDKKNWPLYNNGSLEDFYLKYFKKYLNTNKYEVDNGAVDIYFSDGTIFRMFPNTDSQYAAHGNFYLDKRALENPYTGKNVFVFYWAPAQTSSEQFCEYPILNAYDNGWVPYLYWEERHWDTEKNCAQIDVPTDREEFRNVLLNQENYGCASVNGVSNGAYCTALIEMNGWKIPDDYPIKF